MVDIGDPGPEPEVVKKMMEEIRSGVKLRKVEPFKKQPKPENTGLIKALGSTTLKWFIIASRFIQ